jgi:hypothetical protein
MSALGNATATRWAAVAMREADIRAFGFVVEHLRGQSRLGLGDDVEGAIRTLSLALHERMRRDVLDLLVVSAIHPAVKQREAVAEFVSERFFSDDRGARQSVLQYADLFGEHPGMWDSEVEGQLRREIGDAIEEVVGVRPSDPATGQKEGGPDVAR